MDFDKGIVIQCVECATVFNIDDCDEISYSTSAARCPCCNRWNYVDQPDLFENYIDEMNENDLDETPIYYDFRTGKIEEGGLPDLTNRLERGKKIEEMFRKRREYHQKKKEQRLKEEALGLRPKWKHKSGKENPNAPFHTNKYNRTANKKAREQMRNAYYKKKREKTEAKKLREKKEEKRNTIREINKKKREVKKQKVKQQKKLLAQLKKDLEKAGL
jgi:hypothetical protein